MAILRAYYGGSSEWNTDRLGFDFSDTEDWFVKWDILYIRFSKDEEYKEYGSPHFPAADYDYKHPIDTEVSIKPMSYNIAYWQTEEDRVSGEAEDGGEYDNLGEVIKEAKYIYEKHTCVEVYDEEGETIFHRSSDGDDGFLD